MILSLVDGYIDFSEVQDARESVNVAAPVLHRWEIVSWERFQLYYHLEEVCVVAVHALGTWLDDGSCYVIDELVVEPEAIVKGGDAALFDR